MNLYEDESSIRDRIVKILTDDGYDFSNAIQIDVQQASIKKKESDGYGDVYIMRIYKETPYYQNDYILYFQDTANILRNQSGRAEILSIATILKNFTICVERRISTRKYCYNTYREYNLVYGDGRIECNQWFDEYEQINDKIYLCGKEIEGHIYHNIFVIGIGMIFGDWEWKHSCRPKNKNATIWLIDNWDRRQRLISIDKNGVNTICNNIYYIDTINLRYRKSKKYKPFNKVVQNNNNIKFFSEFFDKELCPNINIQSYENYTEYLILKSKDDTYNIVDAHFKLMFDKWADVVQFLAYDNYSEFKLVMSFHNNSSEPKKLYNINYPDWDFDGGMEYSEHKHFFEHGKLPVIDKTLCLGSIHAFLRPNGETLLLVWKKIAMDNQQFDGKYVQYMCKNLIYDENMHILMAETTDGRKLAVIDGQYAGKKFPAVIEDVHDIVYVDREGFQDREVVLVTKNDNGKYEFIKPFYRKEQQRSEEFDDIFRYATSFYIVRKNNEYKLFALKTFEFRETKVPIEDFYTGLKTRK